MNKSFFIKCLCTFSLVMTISLDASAEKRCGAGEYLAKDNVCRGCPSGQISAEGENVCRTCPDGTEAKNRTECKPCTKGFFCVGGTRKSCLRGSYCPAGSASPIPCEGNTYTPSTGYEKCNVCKTNQIVNPYRRC